MSIIHGAISFHTTRVICITTQKYKVEQLQILWSKEINKSRQKVCLSLYIISVHVHQWPQVYSHSFRVSHVHDHDWKSVAFSRVSRWQNNLHGEFSFRLWKSSIYSFILWLLCTNVEIFGRGKIVKYSPPSWILSRGQQVSISFQASSFKKCYRRCTDGRVWFDICSSIKAVKQQKKTKKILTIKRNLLSNLVIEFHAGGATCRFEITTAVLLFLVKNDII